MDASDKQTVRARLIASGIIRYWQWDKSKRELDSWLEVMAEELADLEDSDAAVKIRESLLAYGLRVPDISRPVHVETPVRSQSPAGTDGAVNDEVCRGLTKADPRGPGVHSVAPSEAEVQQNPAANQGQEVCGNYKNIYPGREDAVYVHPPYFGILKTEEKAADELNEGLGRDITSAIPKSSPISSKAPTGSSTWRNWNYNRVPPALEQAVYEKFKEGWTKSKLAREFRLNRRTIIRICRSYESEHQKSGNDVGVSPRTEVLR